MARLDTIVRHGEYNDACKQELREQGLMSNKRNYTVWIQQDYLQRLSLCQMILSIIQLIAV